MTYRVLAALGAAAVGLAAAGYVLQQRQPEPTDMLLAPMSEAQTCGDLSDVMPGLPGRARMPGLSRPFDPETSDAALSVTSADGSAAEAGEPARVTLTLSDRATGAPLTGQDVAGWMLLQRNAQVAAEMPCRAKAEIFSQGRVTARPDVDLNASRLLILNRDGTVVMANPQVDFTITQMEGVIPLPGVPADWAMGADGRTVFVSLPIYGAVAVIDAVDFRMSGLIEFPKGSLPTTLLARMDGSLAVYLSALESVVIAHPDGSGHSDPVRVGPGPLAMSAGSAGRIFAVSASGTITAIDGDRGAAAALGSLPAGEPSVAVSVRDQAVYVATTASDAIRVFDTGTLTPIGDVPTESGTFTLAKVPGVSQVVALNIRTDRMTLIDSAQHRIVGETATAKAPVEVAFSHDYVYIRGLEGDYFSILERAELAAGRLTPLNVQSASGPVVRREALARARIIAPYGHGALIANEDEAQAYYYMEGMNTPMGTVKTYGQQVQGIMTVNRGFRETGPGVYETTAVLPFDGTYDVPVAIGSPDNVVCLAAEAVPVSGTEGSTKAQALSVTADSGEAPVASAEETFVFTVSDQGGEPVPGLSDLRLLAFAPSGAWQSRKWATDLGGGRYAAAWVFPRAGRYGVSVEAPSYKLGFADNPPFYFKVADKAADD